MKALSVRAPWWWWIINGGKNVENRSRRTHYRGPILIHASTWWRVGDVWQADRIALSMAYDACFDNAPEERAKLITPNRIDHMKAMAGHIVGRADIVDCVEWTGLPHNPWHMPGQCGWILENMRPIAQPFPVKGALGLFNVEVPEDAIA